jgi:uncharacterized protein (DUF433 family)
MYLEMGESLEEIALEFDLPQAAVYAAMAYYSISGCYEVQ